MSCVVYGQNYGVVHRRCNFLYLATLYSTCIPRHLSYAVYLVFGITPIVLPGGTLWPRKSHQTANTNSIYISTLYRCFLDGTILTDTLQPALTEGAQTMEDRTNPPPEEPPVYTSADRAFLLDLAKRSINAVVNGEKPPQPDPSSISEKLKEERSCFVTLRENGELRGCIGGIFPEEPLYMAVIHMASRAATRDPRFPPVTADELEKLHLEISVLSEPQPLRFNSPDGLLTLLRPNIDGVVLTLGPSRSTFLPQVWRQLPDKREFLSRLCVKAGLSPIAWQDPSLKIETYQAESFD